MVGRLSGLGHALPTRAAGCYGVLMSEMDLGALLERPWLFALGLIWIATHAVLMIGMAKLIRAPLFFMAVGSQANIGGAASAPVVASAFHPSLAPVGVLLAVLGYALGTYCAYMVGLMLQWMV